MAKYTEQYNLYLPENEDPSSIHEKGMQDNFVMIEELLTGGFGGGGGSAPIYDPGSDDPIEPKSITDFDAKQWNDHKASNANPHGTQVRNLKIPTDKTNISEVLVDALNDVGHSLKIDSSLFEINLDDTLGNITTSTLRIVADSASPDVNATSILSGSIQLKPDTISDSPVNEFTIASGMNCQMMSEMKHSANIQVDSDRHIYKGSDPNSATMRYMIKQDIEALIESMIRSLVPSILADGTISNIKMTSDGLLQVREISASNSDNTVKVISNVLSVENFLHAQDSASFHAGIDVINGNANLGDVATVNTLSASTATITTLESTTINVDTINTDTANVGTGIFSGTITADGQISSKSDVVAFDN